MLYPVIIGSFAAFHPCYQSLRLLSKTLVKNPDNDILYRYDGLSVPEKERISGGKLDGMVFGANIRTAIGSIFAVTGQAICSKRLSAQAISPVVQKALTINKALAAIGVISTGVNLYFQKCQDVEHMEKLRWEQIKKRSEEAFRKK